MLTGLFYIESHYFSLFAFLNTSACPVKVKSLNWGNFALACIFNPQISSEFSEGRNFSGGGIQHSSQQRNHWVLLSGVSLTIKWAGERLICEHCLSYWKWDLGARFVGIFTVLCYCWMSFLFVVWSLPATGEIYFLLWQLIAPVGSCDCYNTEPKSTPLLICIYCPLVPYLKGQTASIHLPPESFSVIRGNHYRIPLQSVCSLSHAWFHSVFLPLTSLLSLLWPCSSVPYIYHKSPLHSFPIPLPTFHSK